MSSLSAFGGNYSNSRPAVVAYTTSAPSSPISDDNKIVPGAYAFTSDTNCWVCVGMSNTDVATLPTVQAAVGSPKRLLYCPAGVPVGVDVPVGSGAWITARAPSGSTAGNLNISGPITESALGEP